MSETHREGVRLLSFLFAHTRIDSSILLRFHHKTLLASQQEAYAIATQHQLSKKLPLRIMNSTPTEAFMWLASLGLPPLPPQIRQILCTLHERTHTVTRILAPQLGRVISCFAF